MFKPVYQSYLTVIFAKNKNKNLIYKLNLNLRIKTLEF